MNATIAEGAFHETYKRMFGWNIVWLK
jgi:hypothetical protein